MLLLFDKAHSITFCAGVLAKLSLLSFEIVDSTVDDYKEFVNYLGLRCTSLSCQSKKSWRSFVVQSHLMCKAASSAQIVSLFRC